MTKLARYTAGPPWFTPRADAPREIDGWVWADIGISSVRGRRTVRGYVRPPFSIHATNFTRVDAVGETVELHTLSHLPTGHRVFYCYAFDDAMEAAAILGGIAAFAGDNIAAFEVAKHEILDSLARFGFRLKIIFVGDEFARACERIA